MSHKPLTNIYQWHLVVGREVETIEIHRFTADALHQNSYHTIKDLLDINEETLLTLTGIKDKRKQEIVAALDKIGLRLCDNYRIYCERHAITPEDMTIYSKRAHPKIRSKKTTGLLRKVKDLLMRLVRVL